MKQLLHIIFSLFLLLLPAPLLADISISGKVMDNKGKPVPGANVYLNNTIDGGTTDSMGLFSFTTSETGFQSLVVTEISHATMGLPITLRGDTSGIVLVMQASHNLEAVTITAGSFANNDRAKTVLNPLDVVTTAGSNGDIMKAIEMLPGTQQTGTENGLFVRGGDASEAAVLVDEMVVQNAFIGGPPGVASRSRFNPFQYQGMSFSSGGYSSRYGQAMSGILELTTTDLPDKSNINFGVYMAGASASATKRWKNSSLDIGASYTNLAPFYKIATANFDFFSIPVGGSGNVRYVWKPNKDGILKANFSTSYNKSGIAIPNPYPSGDTNLAVNPFPSMKDTIRYLTKDQYYYANVSYKQMFKNKFSLFTAASYSLDQTNNMFDVFGINETDHRAQFRIEGREFISSRVNLLVGTEIQSYGISKSYGFDSFSNSEKFTETQIAGYGELEWTPVYWLAIRPGIRYEHSSLLNTSDVAPRFSAAIKTGRHSQISLAGGIFYQDPGTEYLLPGLKAGMQQAIHYIANWQYSKNERTLRIEGYYKNYQDLIREPYGAINYDPNRYRFISDTTTINNSGYGYAGGFELFWRDKKSIKNADYWISYSYIDTKRLYANFPVMATPTFIASNNLNVVGKYFVDKWKTNFSATYSFATGYPYYNPEKPNPLASGSFLSDRTPTFNNVALTVAYLHSFGKWFTVFYLSVDNIFNIHNVYGYRYQYDATGSEIKGSQTPIVPALYRTIFFGINCSLTQFKKDEL